MKTTLKILVLFFLSQISYSQESRRMIRGQAVNDSLKVENVLVFNASAKTGTIAKENGVFDIKARENDTLVFSSLLFKSKRVLLRKEDVSNPVFEVRLTPFSNQLDEVIVKSKHQKKEKLKPNIGNTRNIVDQKYFDDAQSSPKNTVMPSNVTENGMDFVRMYKDVMRLLRKKNPKKSDLTSSVTFTESVVKKIKYPFFINTLNLEDDEIRLFLVYCENDSNVNAIIGAKSDFILMDYLIQKNSEFKKIVSKENK